MPQLLRVLVVLLQVRRERHHQVVLGAVVALGHPSRKRLGPRREIAFVHVSRRLVWRIEHVWVLPQNVAVDVGQVGHDRVRLAGSQKVGGSEGSVRVNPQR